MGIPKIFFFSLLTLLTTSIGAWGQEFKNGSDLGVILKNNPNVVDWLTLRSIDESGVTLSQNIEVLEVENENKENSYIITFNRNHPELTAESIKVDRDYIYFPKMDCPNTGSHKKLFKEPKNVFCFDPRLPRNLIDGGYEKNKLFFVDHQVSRRESARIQYLRDNKGEDVFLRSSQILVSAQNGGTNEEDRTCSEQQGMNIVSEGHLITMGFSLLLTGGHQRNQFGRRHCYLSSSIQMNRAPQKPKVRKLFLPPIYRDIPRLGLELDDSIALSPSDSNKVWDFLTSSLYVQDPNFKKRSLDYNGIMCTDRNTCFYNLSRIEVWPGH